MDQPSPITMYRTKGCPFCVMAAQFLTDLGIGFEEVFLDDDPDRRKFTADILPGHDTVPLILIGGRAIGGFDELRQMHAQGGLTAILRNDE